MRPPELGEEYVVCCMYEIYLYKSFAISINNTLESFKLPKFFFANRLTFFVDHWEPVDVNRFVTFVHVEQVEVAEAQTVRGPKVIL